MFSRDELDKLIENYSKDKEKTLSANSEYIDRSYLPVFGAIAREKQEKIELKNMYERYLESLAEYYYKDIRLPQNMSETREHNKYLDIKNITNKTWAKMTEYDKRIQVLGRHIEVMIEDIQKNSALPAYSFLNSASQFATQILGENIKPCLGVLYNRENNSTQIFIGLINSGNVLKYIDKDICDENEMFNMLNYACNDLDLSCLFFGKETEVQELCGTGKLSFLTEAPKKLTQSLMLELAQTSNDPVSMENGKVSKVLQDFLSKVSIAVDYGFMGGNFEVYKTQVKLATLGGKANSEDTILDERLFFSNPLNEDYRKFRWPYQNQDLNSIINDFAIISLNENLKSKQLQKSNELCQSL